MPITPFMMEMVASVLGLIRKRDVVFSIDLKDTNFQIPIIRGLESLRLHTWELFSHSPKSHAFLSRLQMLYQQIFGNPSHSSIRESDPGSFIVVVEGTLLHAMPLSKS